MTTPTDDIASAADPGASRFPSYFLSDGECDADGGGGCCCLDRAAGPAARASAPRQTPQWLSDTVAAEQRFLRRMKETEEFEEALWQRAASARAPPRTTGGAGAAAPRRDMLQTSIDGKRDARRPRSDADRPVARFVIKTVARAPAPASARAIAAAPAAPRKRPLFPSALDDPPPSGRKRKNGRGELACVPTSERCSCAGCRAFYDVVGETDPTLAAAMLACARHVRRPTTPPNFWDADF